MSRRVVILTLLALANLSVFAVAEAAPGVDREEPHVVVAVLDTGVTLPGEKRVLAGIDLVAGDADPADENGHGTAVASVIAEDCSGCAILPVRVLSRKGTAPWARVAAGIVWAVDNGARVVNVSIAGPNGSPGLRDAVAYAAAHGVLVVASAGNGGDSRLQYPAAYRAVVAVAATDASGRLADWSSRGAWVDLTAAGCGELPTRTVRRAWACGTSFAAPRAAAAAGRALAEGTATTAGEVAASLPGLVQPASRGAVLRVTGHAKAGAVLRASLDVPAADVRWFRCVAEGSPYACTAVSNGPSYRVRAGDAGRALVARAVTGPFGGLWLASSPPLAVV